MGARMTTKRIVLADDDEDIRSLASLSLARVGGYDVEAVSSGAEALARSLSWRPDVVILDVRMREMDGPGTLLRLRADDRTRTIPVVFLTAGLRLSDRDPLYRLGADGVLIKPFDPMQLPHQLAVMLGWS